MKRVWGKCVFGRPTWNRCCKKITNPVCVTKNAACRVLRKAAIAGLKGARYLVGKSKGILRAAKVVLEGAKHLVRTGKRSLDIVNAFLEGVKRAYQAGTKAVSAIARYGLGGVFDIREIAFDVGLSTAATGHFRVSVTVNIFRHTKRLSLNINLKDITSFAKSLGEKIIGGLKKFIS